MRVMAGVIGHQASPWAYDNHSASEPHDSRLECLAEIQLWAIFPTQGES